MSQALETKITDYSPDSYDYTCISFEPDLKKFGMKQFDDDIYSLFKKRVYDLAGCSPKSISVYLNGKKLSKIKSFSDYVDLFFASKNSEGSIPKAKIYEKVNNRWEVCLAVSETGNF
jgi:DNA topoisomerase-2